MSETTTAIKETVVSVAASWATMTIAEKKAALETSLNAEIASTTSSWVKVRDQLYLAMLSYANEYLLNKINSWIS